MDIPKAFLSWDKDEDRLSSSERQRFERKLETLEAVLERALSDVRTLKHDVQWRFATEFCQLDRPIPANHHRFGAQLFTTGGSTRGIREKIRETLLVRNEPMTSAQIAEAIYVYDPKVSFDLFKRRVIVAASSMHKEEDPPILIPAPDRKGSGREIHWSLNPEIILAPSRTHFHTFDMSAFKQPEPPEGGSNHASDERKKVDIAT